MSAATDDATVMAGWVVIAASALVGVATVLGGVTIVRVLRRLARGIR